MYPKQLLPLAGDRTMLQETARRLGDMANTSDDCLVVCNEAHRFLVAEQLREIGVPARIVLEPEGRNTAPAVALAALLAAEDDANTILLVMPADHVIEDTAAFHEAVTAGVAAARKHNLVTFGIVPDRPETGYGYLEARPQGAEAVALSAFVEKPDLATAEAYVGDGEHFWNSGMFLFTARD
jgi:mannose-1-phosphate guanylyltransferase/mannose-6-phosphate isomerase